MSTLDLHGMRGTSTIKQDIIELENMMGLISIMFGNRVKRPTKSQWRKITDDISDGLASVRIDWYNQCKNLLSADGINILNETLHGKALTCALAHQRFYATELIRNKRFIASADMNQFLDLLYYKTCASNKILVTEYQNKFFTQKVTLHDRLDIICADIYGHITTDKVQDSTNRAVRSSLNELTRATQEVVSACFGDLNN